MCSEERHRDDSTRIDDETPDGELENPLPAHGGDRLDAVDALLDEIVEDLNASMVDNSSREIAEVDALLGI